MRIDNTIYAMVPMPDAGTGGLMIGEEMSG
jgi:hypothetical protein